MSRIGAILLSCGILLLDLTVGRNKAEGLGLGFDDLGSVAAKNNDNVKVFKTLVGLFEGNLGANNNSGIRENLGLVGSDGDIEGLGF